MNNYINEIFPVDKFWHPYPSLNLSHTELLRNPKWDNWQLKLKSIWPKLATWSRFREIRGICKILWQKNLLCDEFQPLKSTWTASFTLKNRNNNNSNNNNYYYYYYHYYDCYYISYPPFPWNPLYPAQKQSFFFDTFIKILISVKSNRIQLWCSSMSIITLFRWKDFPDLADLVDFFLYFTQCVLAIGEWCMCLFWFSPQILNERYKQYHEVRSPWVNPCLLI